MDAFNPQELRELSIPTSVSHKGQNGKLLIIAGSTLFHAASLWPLEIASKIVDMVYYSSIEENNEIVKEIKKDWRNGIVIPRNKVDQYIEEADAILIGPGLPRKEGEEKGDDDTKLLTEKLLREYPNKQWIIDGGSLQTINPDVLPKNAILTPHHQEFEALFGIPATEKNIQDMAKKYACVILVKGDKDTICSATSCVHVVGGNAGMSKAGTGDVLAGLVAALATKNDPFLAAKAGSYFNKKAGENLYKKVGFYFNASDLVEEIPIIMASYLTQ